MYDITELEPTTKELAVSIIIVVVVLAVTFFAGYMLGSERTEDIYNNGTGTGDVGEQLGEAVQHQSEITAGIKDAESTVQGIAGTGQAIAESADRIEAGVGEAAGIIDESQQILGRIRNRGQANQIKN